MRDFRLFGQIYMIPRSREWKPYVISQTQKQHLCKERFFSTGVQVDNSLAFAPFFTAIYTVNAQ